MNVDTVTERVRAEFDGMPELKLTVPQASRFFGLDEQMTQSVLERLVGIRIPAEGERRQPGESRQVATG